MSAVAVVTAVILTGFVSVPNSAYAYQVAQPISEIEPNDTSDTAQHLAAIGLNNWVDAAINPAGDKDWFRFDAVAGRTYVIELYNVASTLGGSGDACAGLPYQGRGLGFRVYDSALTLIKDACNARPQGNIHNRAEFTAGTSGEVHIKVIPNDSAASGTYKIRVCLPPCRVFVYLPLILK